MSSFKPTLTIVIGPPGSGKSTLARGMVSDAILAGKELVYVNQDSQGADHKSLFIDAAYAGKDIVVDRMNFNIQQRMSFIEIAKLKDYHIKAIVKCESQATCIERMLVRTGHETIKNEKSARSALQTFMTKYEPPTKEEGIDEIVRIYPEGQKESCIVVDLDGTLCNVEHRRHFVRDLPEGQKKNWAGFFAGIADDTVNQWCLALVWRFLKTDRIVYCSGRSENFKKVTTEWLTKHAGMNEGEHYSLFMRHRADSRQDYIVKEILLDFEILTRFKPFFMVDDRKQVVDLWRRRGFVCLHCDEGDF